MVQTERPRRRDADDQDTSVSSVAPPVPPHLVSGVEDGQLVYYRAPRGHLCRPSDPRHLQRHLSRALATATAAEPPVPALAPHVLLIVNPRAGTGSASALSRLLRTVTRVLAEGGVQATLRQTSHRGHVRDILAELGAPALQRFAALVAVGGDGTLQELVVALLHVCATAAPSLPWSSVPPVAVVPNGTGNAIAESMGILSPVHAALNVVHSLRQRNAAPLALLQFSCVRDHRPPLLSVGGVQWGFSAEVDQRTESLRWLGDLRFQLGALAQIVQRRAVRGKIVVHVHHHKNEQVWNTIDTARRLKHNPTARSIRHGLERDPQGNYVLDGTFMMLVAWNSALIGEGFMVTPHAKPTETGVFDLLIVRGHISRSDMLKMLLSSDDGSFLHFTEQCCYFKAQKIVIDQLDGAFLTVDGESVPVKPFVLEMAPQDGKLRILDSFSGANSAP
ncbi:unnamed protein product [Agarophyton chilense]